MLATLPPDVNWLWRAGSHYCACRRYGADAELLWLDGSTWHACTVPHVGCMELDVRGRGLVFAEDVLWELRVTEQPALRARATIPAGVSACYLAERIVILTADGVLRVLDDSCAWRIPHGGTDPSSHAWSAIAAAGDVLLVTEVPASESELESDVLHVLQLEPPRRLACWVAEPAHADDEGRIVLLDRAIGPFEGVGVDPKRVQRAAIPEGVVGLDHAYFTITHIDGDPACALEQVDALQLDTQLPSPTIVQLETTRFDPPVPDLAALKPLSRRLFELMRQGGLRPEPDAQVTALLTLPLPLDLYAYLHIWAHYVADVRFESIDWWTHVRPEHSEHPLLQSDALFGITLGTTGGGQHYVAQVHDAGKAVFRGIEDSGEAFVTGHDLESFLRALVYQTHRQFPKPTTAFDDLL